MSSTELPKHTSSVRFVFVVVAWGFCLAVLFGVWLLETSSLSPEAKVGVFALAAISWPLLSVVYRRMIAQVGFTTSRGRELLAMLAKAQFPKAEERHADIESFLEEIQQCNRLSPELRMAAARRAEVVARGRAEHLFANLESEALDMAFADYRRLGIGTDRPLRADED